jgi:nucleoid DNA-binding protein
MNGKEFATALANKTESTNASADRTIAAFIEIISAALKKGDSVSLVREDILDHLQLAHPDKYHCLTV